MISRRTIILGVIVLLFSLTVGARIFASSGACGDSREQLLGAEAREQRLPGGDVPCSAADRNVWAMRIIEGAFVAGACAFLVSLGVDVRSWRARRTYS